jgi:hypothetical protein
MPLTVVWQTMHGHRTSLTAKLVTGPRSSADRAEDLLPTDPAPTSHWLKGSAGEVVGRAMSVALPPSLSTLTKTSCRNRQSTARRLAVIDEGKQCLEPGAIGLGMALPLQAEVIEKL